MKRLIPILLLLGACCPSNTINADAIDGTLRRVLDRHDVYVREDATLTDLSRRVHLRDAEVLRMVLDEASK